MAEHGLLARGQKFAPIFSGEFELIGKLVYNRADTDFAF